MKSQNNRFFIIASDRKMALFDSMENIYLLIWRQLNKQQFSKRLIEHILQASWEYKELLRFIFSKDVKY